MILPGLEPGTFRVLGERDNHYITESLGYDVNLNPYHHLGMTLNNLSWI